MRLYLHTDRNESLQPGFTVEKEPYHDESLLAVYSPFMDTGFIDHLMRMAKDGLSLHGARYLIQLNDMVNFPNLTTELYFEYIRWKHYCDKPSRLQSLFAWQTFEDALAFARETGKGKIYEVQGQTAAFVGDMNHMQLSLNPKEQEEIARGYWEGLPYDRKFGYHPKWEYLLSLPVEIVREVLVNPVDMKP